MPDFLGIGAQKCGTTWLYQTLGHHPAIRFPAGKEVHFWNRHRDLGIDWWLNLFPKAAPGISQGEITPAYAMLPRPVIAEMRQAVPSIKLIYSIRNPIDRAWSAALMALRAADMRPEEASDQWFLDHFHSEGSRRRGNYLDCIDNYLSIFDSSQLLVLLLDDIAQQPYQVLDNIAQYLGVDPRPMHDLSRDLVCQPVFEGQEIALRPSLRQPLLDLYGDMISTLEKRLSRSLAPWFSAK